MFLTRLKAKSEEDKAILFSRGRNTMEKGGSDGVYEKIRSGRYTRFI